MARASQRHLLGAIAILAACEGSPTIAGTDTDPGPTPTPPRPPDPMLDDGSTDIDEPVCAAELGCWPDLLVTRASCDLFKQDCPPGQKCMPWASTGWGWDATGCSEVHPDPRQVGEPCVVLGSASSGIDNCDVGLMCRNVDDTGAGICEDLCTGSAAIPLCDDDDDACAITNQGVIALCLPRCDPLVQDCIDSEACYPVNDEWVCVTSFWAEPRHFGDACWFINDCAAGLVCVPASAFTRCESDASCCTSVCDLDDPLPDARCDDFDAAQRCVPWYAEGHAPSGYAHVGVCAVLD